ncbi:hypothetical protein GCM10027080_14460 [Pedococcus soli]
MTADGDVLVEALANEATVTTIPVAATRPAAAVMMVLLGTVVLPSGAVPGRVARLSPHRRPPTCGEPVVELARP